MVDTTWNSPNAAKGFFLCFFGIFIRHPHPPNIYPQLEHHDPCSSRIFLPNTVANRNVITYHQFPSHMIKYHHNVYYPSSFYHLGFLTKRAKKYHSCRGETRGPALVEINDCKSFENFEFCDVIHDIHGY
jgi:hypothetical protein